MKRILFVMILGACMATGCTHTGTADAITHNVPVEKYMDLKQLEQLCKSDTLHNKALIFCSPYCGGCRHEFKEYILPAMEEVDTSLWRFYYLIVVESKDTLRYNELMRDSYRMGVDTNNAYIWRLDFYREDYNKVFSLFQSTHALENSIHGIPRTLLLDKNNFIANERRCYIDQRDSFWYEPRNLDKQIIQFEDFTIEDPEWYIMVSR